MPQLDIVVVAGNHDSPGRLEAPGPLLEAHGTRVVGHVVRGAMARSTSNGWWCR
jgi:exonuclease SbcD